MGPDYDRWSVADEDNVQAPVEMPPLKDAPTSVRLVSKTDVETTKRSHNPREGTTQKIMYRHLTEQLNLWIPKIHLLHL